VYGREVDGRELNFEASGALMQATLVMRDRETDSWWSIMTSDAIGGELDGTDLEELPFGEKTTWGDWKSRYPETLVLSVGGAEHIENNPYDNYFASEGTFRDLKIDDDRLPPKENIFSFWLQDLPWAATHRAIEGGKLYPIEGLTGRLVFLHRVPGTPMYASSDAYLVDEAVATEHGAGGLLAHIQDHPEAAERLNGFDTFWYSWVAINKESRLLD
jgi:hypothetical protein